MREGECPMSGYSANTNAKTARCPVCDRWVQVSYFGNFHRHDRQEARRGA